MRFLVPCCLSFLLLGCAGSEQQAEPPAAGVSAAKLDAAPVAAQPTTPPPAPAPAIVPDAAAIASQTARSLIGADYVRAHAMPSDIADGWQVVARISPPAQRELDFLALSKGEHLVLVSAAREVDLGRQQHRFRIRDAWAVLDHDGLAQAVCAPADGKSAPVFGLIRPGAPGAVALMAHVVPGSERIAAIAAGDARAYRCRYRQQGRAVLRQFGW